MNRRSEDDEERPEKARACLWRTGSVRSVSPLNLSVRLIFQYIRIVPVVSVYSYFCITTFSNEKVLQFNQSRVLSIIAFPVSSVMYLFFARNQNKIMTKVKTTTTEVSGISLESNFQSCSVPVLTCASYRYPLLVSRIDHPRKALPHRVQVMRDLRHDSGGGLNASLVRRIIMQTVWDPNTLPLLGFYRASLR